MNETALKTSRLGILACCLALTACASISVQSEHEAVTEHRPTQVFVQSFTTANADIRVDREGDELAEFNADLQKMMSAGISTNLTKRLIPASIVPDNQKFARQEAWVIRGEFVRVYQGSRLLRGTVGFGLGATKLVCRVRVYNLAGDQSQPFLTFVTTGGSNAEPGAITAFSTDPLSLVIQIAAGGAGNIAHGLTEDSARTSREVTAKLSDYMYQRGWIPKDQWVKPKVYSD